MTQDPKLVEAPVRFSESKLWQIQRNYFATMGVNAWEKEVPFYISSNAFAGQRYALLVINFIRDWQNKNGKMTEPFYLIELGCGTGRFGFYFLKSFKALLKEYQLKNVSFVYVMTDLIEDNLKFCQENEGLRPYIGSKELDLAQFNVEEDRDLYLQIKQQKLSDLSIKTPLIVIANYTFDCIKHDAFEYKDGKLYEVKLGLHSRYKNFDSNNVKHLNELFLDYHLNAISPENYYENPILNRLLKQYAEQFSNKHAVIMIPLGALQFIDHLKALSTQFFMIVGDKGVCLPEKFAFLDPKLRGTYDGCYSFIVNFHAIGEYLRNQQGDCLLTLKASDFKVNLFGHGLKFDDLTDTKACFNTLIEKEGPDEYCYLYEEFAAHSYRFSLKSLLAFLKLSQFDPEAYAAIHQRLLELALPTHPLTFEEVKMALKKVKENIYPASMGDDVYNLLGVFYQSFDLNEEALALYQLSIKHFGKKSLAHHNAGLLYEKQKNIPKALSHYEAAYGLNKKDHLAQRKTAQLKGKPYFGYFYPLLKGLVIFGALAGLIYFINRG